MKNWTGTVSKTARAFVACALAFLASSAGAATVRDIGIKTHYPWNGKVDVTYAVTNIANGSSYHVTAKLVAGGQTWCTYATNVHANAGYAFQWDVTAAGFKGRVEDAQVLFTVDEPQYVVIDLSAGPAATEYPVAYVNPESIDDEYIRTNIAFKTDWLLLKRINSANGVTNYVGVFEVTQRQYERVVGSNPSFYSLYSDATVPAETRQLVEWQRPVERLSYDILVQTEGFFDRLTRRTGLDLALPTKEEWQTVAAGATDKEYNLGLDKYYNLAANMSLNTWLDPVPFRYGFSGNQVGNQYCGPEKGTATVGSYAANDNGLYDMHGNVSEWTQTTEIDPSNLKTVGVLCGGDYVSTLENCKVQSTRTMAQKDGTQFYYTGFRVFGAEPDDSFEKQTAAASVKFAIDVAHWPYGGADYAAAFTNVRYLTVADFATEENRKNYEFTYFTNNVWETARQFEGGSRPWVSFDEGDKTWRPTLLGLNIVSNGAEQAMFYVKDLPWEGITTNNVAELTYDGAYHDRTITITKPWTNYKVEYGESPDAITNAVPPKYIDQGAYTVWYRLVSLEPGAFYKAYTNTYPLTIWKRSVAGAKMVNTHTDIRYTGLAQTQTVQNVTLDITNLWGSPVVLDLVEGRDFVVYDNVQTDAKGYTLRIIGINNYCLEQTNGWEICPIDLTKNAEPVPTPGSDPYPYVEAPATGVKVNTASDEQFRKHGFYGFYYNGHPQTNYVLSVSVNSTQFWPGSASFVESNNSTRVATDVGVYTNYIRGIKNFQGTIGKIWEIRPMPITNATVYLDEEFDYNGDCQTRNVTNVTVETFGYTVEMEAPGVPDAVVPSYTIDVPAKWYYVRGNTGTNASAKVGPYTLGVWAKSREGNNFCGHVYTNWFIGQRDLTNAVFTVNSQKAYDYVYDRTGKEPKASAKDWIDDGTHDINPVIVKKETDAEPDWLITNYLDNVDVGGDPRVVFAATTNGNYRGFVTNSFKVRMTPATITNVTVKTNFKAFTYDGTAKGISVGRMDVWANNLKLNTDEYAVAGTKAATATGRYWVYAEPKILGDRTVSNYVNLEPPASDFWDIVPAAPVLTWTTPKGAQFVTNENGIVLFGVSDLTVAADSRCGNEKLIYDFVTPSGRQPTVSGDKFHVTERTTITARSVWTDTETGLALTGAVTTVTLAPGQCADPEIFISETADGYVSPTNFNRNATRVTIRPSALVTVAPNEGPTNVLDAASDPFWPAWRRTTGCIEYYLLDGMTNEVDGSYGWMQIHYSPEDEEWVWECTNLTVSADTVFVVAQITDDNYTDSIVVTQKLTRVIDDLDEPTITIEKVDAMTRKVTMSAPAGATIFYTTEHTLVTPETPLDPDTGLPLITDAEKPTADCELDDEYYNWWSWHETEKYTKPFTITLNEVDEAVDIKAIAYNLIDTNHDGTNDDFTARSPVADAKSFREWHEGEALDAPDQVFTNGWTQLKVPNVENPDAKTQTPALDYIDTPWRVALVGTDPLAEGAVGKDCMRSGALTNSNQLTSSISTTVEGAGYVVFRWKAHCEDDPNEVPTWDHGEFILDGVITNRIDGVTDWQTVALAVTNGTHTLTWRYVKDFAKHGVDPTTGKEFAEGEDCVLLDSFLFTRALSFGEFEVTVDPLVYNMKDQLPTNEVLASGMKTNYIHTALVLDPSTKIPVDLIEGRDYTVVTNGDSKPKCDAGENYTVTLEACKGSFFVKGSTNVTWKILPLSLANAVVQVDTNAFTYTGGDQTVNVTNLWATHYRDGLISVKDAASWSPTSATETDQGSYTLQVTGTGNLTGNAPVVNWSIGTKSIADCTVKLAWTSGKYYNRQAQTPKVTVKATEPATISADDYAVTYLSKGDYSTDVTNAGTKVAIVTAKPGCNWSGAVTNDYAIWRAVVDTLTLDGQTEMTYTGGTCTVDGEAKMDKGSRPKMTLLPAEWQITGNSAVDAGTYTASVQIVDTTNFKYVDDNPAKAPKAEWKILPVQMSAANVEIVPTTYSFEYDGTAKNVTIDNITSATANGLALDKAWLTVNCTEQTEVGSEYTFSLSASSRNFTGESQNFNWSITPRSLANATITLTTNLVWNGVTVITNNGQRLVRTVLTNATEQTMTFTVEDKLPNGTVTNLVLGTDYAIVPGTDKGTNACKYVLQITGLGNYAAATSNEWVIAPSLVTITPNVENPGTNEVIYAEKDVQRVQMERDDGDWTLLMRRTFFDAEGKEAGSYVNPFRSFVVGQRTQVDGWAVTADGVTGSVRTVDFRIGHAAEPFAVLADTNNVPLLYEDGTPWTNTVDGAVITNFCHNGQLVYLTRGNLAVSNDVTGARILFTNSTDEAYTDGILRYTIDGTEPTAESAAWTAESRLAISNTTTVLSKVFGGQFIDSPVVTNVFVRDMEQYSAPKIEYLKYGSSPEEWPMATNGETVVFSVIGQKARITDTNDVGGTIYWTTNGVTTNVYTEAISFDRTTTLTAWIGDQFDVHNYSNSPTVAVEFSCDTKLATPVIAFSNATDVAVYQQDDKVFTNAYQYVQITRGGDTFTRYTDGTILYKFAGDAEYRAYTAPLKIWNTTNVYAYVKTGTSGFADSDETNVVFTQVMKKLDDLTVVITNTPTVKQVAVTITNNTGNAVYYTLDGSDPIGVNPSGATNGEKFTETFRTFVRDIAIGETLVVKAVAYAEVTGGKDYVAVSEVAEDSFTRNWTIGDSIKPDDPAKQWASNRPDASDMTFVNDATVQGDTNTAWVVDETYFVATNAQGKGSSMRSGAARSGDEGEPETHSYLTTTVRGPGTLTFKWASSTEFDEYDSSQKFDVGTFYADDEVVAEISGTNGWKEVSFTIVETNEVAQDHTLVWEYAKDWMDDEYIFEKFDIQDCIWVDEFVWTCVPDMKQCDAYVTPIVYDREIHLPTIVVTNRTTGVELTNGVDYVVEVTSTNKPGTFGYTLKGLGTTYTGTLTGTWKIDPLSLEGATVKLSEGQMYTCKSGNEITQYAVVESIKAKLGKREIEVADLVNEWTASETNGIDAATYTATIAGNDGLLTGSVSTNWVIKPRPLTNDYIKLTGTLTYAGGAERTKKFNVSYGGVSLGSSDYTLVEGSNKGTTVAGNTIQINAVEGGNFTGSAEKAWTMNPLDISAGSVNLNPTNLFFNTKEQYVAMTNVLVDLSGWTDNPISLTNELWTIEGTNGTDVGTYWVVVTPLAGGNLTGTAISNKWEILPASIADCEVVLEPYNTYNGSSTPQWQLIKSVTHPTLGALTKGVDYKEYAKNANKTQAGKYTLEVEGIGNYCGSKPVNYELLPAKIDSVVLDPASFVYDSTEKTLTTDDNITVKAGELTATFDKDYFILPGSVLAATTAGVYTVTVTGSYDKTIASGFTGNFVVPTETLTTNVTWEIAPRPIELTTITYEDLTYNREVQTPVSNIVDTAALITEADFTTAIDPAEVKQAGTYTVTVTGQRNYTGVTNVTFEVKKATIQSFTIKGASKIEYSGNEVTIDAMNVKTDNGLTLEKGEWKFKDEGTTTYHATEVGDYSAEILTGDPANIVVKAGGLSKPWKIYAMDISGADVEVKVSLKKDIQYTPYTQTIGAGEILGVTVIKGGTKSFPLTDYSIDCAPQKTVGKHTATVTATGSNFKGTASVEWEIVPRDISAATASDIRIAPERILWTGSGVAPTLVGLTVGGIDFAGDELAGLTLDNVPQTDAGEWELTVTGTGNFTGTTGSRKWEIAPRAPAITPNDGTGKYTKLTDYVTVEINNDRDDQLWKIYYTTNDWAETMVYPNKGWKFDIDRHTVVQAYAVSCDGIVTGETSRCEYFFGKRNVTPTIALTAKAGAEEGRPTSWMQDGLETVVTGEAQIITFKNVGGVVTNFFHKETRVALTRFGGMTQAEMDAIVERETVAGLCPYTDGEIWYTVAENGAPVVDPTNATGFTSRKFDKDDVTTWPLISTNAVIVAKVFGDQLESSATVTNAFFRQWTAVAAPTIDPTTGSFQFSQSVTIKTNHTANADWWFTNGVEKIYYTLDDNAPTTGSTLYTNVFDVTWKDMLPGTTQVVVKAYAYVGEDFINSGVVTATYDHYKGQFDKPTLTESAEFRHAEPNGFSFTLTNNAPRDVGGKMMYSIDGGASVDCGDVEYFTHSVKTTSTVRVWIEATGEAHDYYTSETNEATYTYNPYKMVAPTFDKDEQTFTGKDFTFTISLPTEDPGVEDYEHIYHGTLYYKQDDGEWTAVTGSSKEFTVSETTTVSIMQKKADHIDSDIVTKTFTRFVQVPKIEFVNADETQAYVEEGAGVTNFFHKAFVKLTAFGGDTHVEYTLTEEGQAAKSGTYADKLPVANTFTVTAKAKTEGGSESATVSAIYTRQWETLVKPAITLIDPYGDSQTTFENTGDRIAITNDLTALVQHAAVLWPTNFTVKYAVYTNSEDVTTVPENWAKFVQGVTTNFFKADTNAVWAIVEAEDYLPCTNAVSFTRQLGEVSEPTIFLDNSTSRTNVTVSILQPVGAGAVRVYYTFAVTNKTAEVAEPVGNEYDVTKTSARYEGPFDVAIKPDQTVIVKARCYVEDSSSALVGVAETNFTARGSVVTNALALAWTIGDALDAPDQTFVTYDTVAKTINNVCLEDTKVFTTGGSSMVYTNLVDNETVTISTTVTGPGTVVFDWKTSCEKGQHGFNRDHMAFSVDGVEIACLDGDSGWQTVTNYVSGLADATHTLAWSYKKDASEKQRDDSAWLDHFQWVASDEGIVISEDMTTWARGVFGDDYVDTVLSPGGVVNAEEWTAALALTGANGRSYYDCYVLGLDVDDPDSQFEAGSPELVYIEDLEGKLVLKSVTIGWTPCTKAGRTYTLVGKRELIETSWMILAEENATADDSEGGSITASLLNETFKDCKFFQLRVRMTK